MPMLWLAAASAAGAGEVAQPGETPGVTEAGEAPAAAPRVWVDEERRVVVEDEVDIYGGVVLGALGGPNAPPNGFPTICFDAVLCVGAKVLGLVTVGRHATVAAGAVVLESVPDWALAAGVPDRTIRSSLSA